MSAYHLSYEKNTVFSKFLKSGKLTIVDEVNSIEQFQILCEESSRRGYEQYEISNFAVPGFVSRHNSAYWMQKSYLGIGPSAHSYNGVMRSWNISDLKKYLIGIIENKTYFEEEILTDKDNYNDYVITSLRTIWGTNINTIKEKYGNDFALFWLNNSVKHIQDKKILLNNNILTLTNEGKIISDKIIEDLFYY